jgi:GT2 family glycosyltransferase
MVEPLIGQSRYAYSLWQLRYDAEANLAKSSPRKPLLPILIGLDLSAGEDGLAATLESVDQAKQDVTYVKFGLPELDPVITPKAPFWLLPIRPGDKLAPGALAAYAAVARTTDNAIIYADDDLIDTKGHRSRPHFKPEWNAELHQWHDLLSYSCMLRIDDPSELIGIAERADWLDLLIKRRLSTEPNGVAHLHQMLHHRRARPLPRLPIIEDRIPLPELPMVTVIIPTRNRVELLSKCIEGLRATRYPKLDLIVIDNDSDEPATLAYLEDIKGPDCRILPYHGAFNYSAMNNAAAIVASGEFLCFLNNDIEMLDEDWLIHLVQQAIRPDVGATGARLLYPDGSIQHAAVVIGVGGGAAHAHRYLRPEDDGYFSRHNLPQFASAVTGACIVVSRDKFLAVEGFDEVRFPVAFNDVDLCLKLNARGWQSLYEPRATLIHHESKSRGKDTHKSNRVRFAAELAALKERWHTDRVVDPYHHPWLSQFSEQFVIRL